MRTTSSYFPLIDKNKQLNKTLATEDQNFKTRLSYNEIPLTTQINNGKLVKKQLTMRDSASTQQINPKNFIKDFSNKLEKHQYDIEKRDEMIKELELTIEKLRLEYINERQNSDEKNRQIKDLIESNEKLNNRFKNNHIKMEELITKVQFYEKEFQKIKDDETKAHEQKNLELIQTKKIEDLEQKIKEMSQELSTHNSQITEADKQKNNQINELTTKLNESLQNGSKLKIDLEKKTQELSKALETIKAYEEEKKQVENNIQSLRRTSTLKQQELESKFKEQENLAKALQGLKDENSKLKQSLEEQQQSKTKQQNENSELAQQNNSLKEQINKLNGENSSLNKQIQDSKSQIIQLEQQINQKNDKLQNMLKELENTRNKQSSNDKNQQDLKQNFNDLKKKFDETEQKISIMTGQLQNIQKSSKKLDEAEKEIIKSLKCNYCEQFIKEPITIIPCGHSFCFSCKKAYAKDCIKCGPKVKVEAMYRNELLDDIIGMVKILQNLQTFLKV
ncbi:hypothetical protein ABPG72_019062 [Tetrahymena utriculariae]